MKITHFVVGAYETNCYLLRQNQSSTDCLVIDPGLDSDPVVDFLRDNQLNPAATILTHGHIDHIWGLGIMRKNYPDTKIYIHKLDSNMLTQPHTNLSNMTESPFKTAPADTLLEDGDAIEQAGIKLDVLHTPGHTPGGICLYSKEDGVVFTGDTLFADSVGRTDFPGGSMTDLIAGIKQKLCTLPDETKVYPGHGPVTTIAREKAQNQYLI